MTPNSRRAYPRRIAQDHEPERRPVMKILALDLAQLSALNQLRLVHVPERETREWRALINYRHRLIRQRTSSKNHLRDVLNREGLWLLRGAAAWTIKGMEALVALARPLTEVAVGELWRGEL